MDIFSSPLRYPGGKRKLVNFVKIIFKLNGLMDGRYVEPYAGGAAIALTLLFHEYASEVFINDKSRPVYAFWHSAVNRTQDFIELVRGCDVSMDEWQRQKDVQARRDTADLLELGFSTFYLNRTNRSGILNGGVIGGMDQSGVWKLDVRFNKPSLIERIKKIGKYRTRINISNLDAVEFLTNVYPQIQSPSFLNLDPPYYIKGQSLYDNFYAHDDHIRIAEVMSTIKGKWMVTYDNVPTIRTIYSDFRQSSYDLSYTAQVKQTGSELAIYSNGLRIPNVSTPASIKSRVVAEYRCANGI